MTRAKAARTVSTRRGIVFVAAILCVLIVPQAAQAYAGPGAGFAILSSFLTLFLAFLYAMFALVTWPVRQVFRFFRRRRVYGKARVKRMVIIGFDGMDPELATRWMNEGKLPNLARLREQGTFRKLATTLPPISPVAWSSFLTGVNPGKHNIYDFLRPNRHRYLPELSSAEVRGPKRTLRIGRYAIPLGKPQIKALRKARPFWHDLAKAGVFCSVIRVPITFPPEKFSGLLLSGMCVPDVKGSQGTFSFHTTRPSCDAGSQRAEGHVVVPLERRNGLLHSYVPGPVNPLRPDSKDELRVPFTLKTIAARGQAELTVDHKKYALREGQYSEWIELKFKAGLGVRVHGICRFYLKSAGSEPEVYVTPVNIHPMRPALPIAHPLTYSIYLAKLSGLYATLGLAEDTWALNDGVLSGEAFLEQCYLIHGERERMFLDALEKTPQGVCVCVFDITDRVQHMFWRHLENGRATESRSKDSSAQVIEELYRRMDELVGRMLAKLGKDTLVLVLSDHGFKSFARGVNLNTWLHQNGYLNLKTGKKHGDWFEGVDWERTRAYALGLNGIFLNLRGRERHGIVEPGEEAAQLRSELATKLRTLADPETSAQPIHGVFEGPGSFSGPYTENAPDLVVGFAEGYRASWESVQGRVTQRLLEVNTKCWSGDHCIHPDLVPGVLFSNWKVSSGEISILDIAPTVLSLFGLKPPGHYDGHPWEMQASEPPEAGGLKPAPTQKGRASGPA